MFISMYIGGGHIYPPVSYSSPFFLVTIVTIAGPDRTIAILGDYSSLLRATKETLFCVVFAQIPSGVYITQFYAVIGQFNNFAG